MKKYIILAAAATVVLLGGCAKTESYSPGPEDEGMGYYFASNATSTTVEVKADKLSCSVELLRAKTDGAVSKAISVNDTSSIFFPNNSVNFDFSDKANKAKLTFDIEREKLAIGKKYAIGFKIPSESSSYAPDSVTVIVNYPEPWKKFAKAGHFEDAFLFPMVLGAPGGPVDVTVEQNDLDPKRYRITNPYKVLLSSLGASQDENGSEFLNFTILNKGDKLNGVDITENGIVVFDMHNVGYVVSSFGEDAAMIHKSDAALSGKTWYAEEQTMDTYKLSRVVAWIDEANLVPGIIYFDAFVAGCQSKRGWFASDYSDAAFKLIMPDYVMLDTSVDVQFNHFVFDKNYKPSVSVAVTLGEDVALAKAVAIQGTDYEAALEGILENENAVDVLESGDVIVPLPADAETGKWSVVVATFSEDGGAYKEGDAAYVSFNFVKAGDSPDPATFEYGANDIIAAISKEDLIGTSWNLYASYFDEEANDYSLIENLGAITISDQEDAEDAEEDVILVKGMSAGAGEYYGFDDTMAFEYYEGVIYSLTYEMQSFNVGANTFYIEPEIGYAASGEHSASAEDAYLMLGGLVSDDILAFVETDVYASYGVAFDGSVYWSAYSATGDEEEPYSSLGTVLELLNPRFVAAGAEAAQAPASRLNAIKKSFNHRSNFVETERAYLQRCIREHVLPKNIGLGTKQVVETGKVVKKVEISKTLR